MMTFCPSKNQKTSMFLWQTIEIYSLSFCLSDDNSTNDADNDYHDEYEERENSASEEEISRNSKIENK